MNWQPIIATVIVAIAAAWLFRQITLTISAAGRKGDGGAAPTCGSCPNNPQVQADRPIVQLETIGRKSTRKNVDATSPDDKA